jgi:multidrug resistance efflux pump
MSYEELDALLKQQAELQEQLAAIAARAAELLAAKEEEERRNKIIKIEVARVRNDYCTTDSDYREDVVNVMRSIPGRQYGGGKGIG